VREERIGTVGLDVTAPGTAPDVPQVDGKGRGVIAGARVGAESLGLLPPDPLSGAFTPLFMRAAAAGGAVYGAVAAPRDDDRYAANSHLSAALKEIDFGMLVRDRIRSRARVTTKFAFAPVDVIGEEPLDHRLDIEIDGPALLPEGEFDPELTLVAEAGVCLRRVGKKAFLYTRRWLYRDVAGPYFQVAANYAAVLRGALPAAAERLADRIMMDVSAAVQP
jgi:hypothetical protein